MDVAAFRHLGLRGHPYARPATDALTQVGVALSELNLGADTSGTDTDASGKNAESDQLNKTLERVLVLSRALDLLNLFFTYGINGKWNSTKGYSRHIQKNLQLIREARVPGYQTLEGYLDRYFAAAQEIERLQERYNTLRMRITEAADLLRARFDKLQLVQLNKSAVQHTWVMITSVVTAAGSMVVASAALFLAYQASQNRSSDRKLLGSTISTAVVFAIETSNRETDKVETKLRSAQPPNDAARDNTDTRGYPDNATADAESENERATPTNTDDAEPAD